MSENETAKMLTAKPTTETPTTETPTSKMLTPEAQRALAEADGRRREATDAESRPREVHGRGGKEPVRYGDWEIKGLACDF